MRLSFSTGLIGLALLISLSAGAAGASHVGTGIYNTSMMAVQRERQEKIKKCGLFAGFDSATMTYSGSRGRRVACP
jgi:hypothetical protein